MFGLWSLHPASVQSHLNCDGVWLYSLRCVPVPVSPLQLSDCFQSAAACSVRALPTPGTESRTRRSRSDHRDPSGPGGALWAALGPGVGWWPTAVRLLHHRGSGAGNTETPSLVSLKGRPLSPSSVVLTSPLLTPSQPHCNFGYSLVLDGIEDM